MQLVLNDKDHWHIVYVSVDENACSLSSCKHLFLLNAENENYCNVNT